MQRTTLPVLVCVSLTLLALEFVCGQSTLRIEHKGRKYYGRSVAWDGQNMMLLRRDGRTSLLPVTSNNDYERVSSSFKPFSRDLLRSRLQKEFGRKYTVSVTDNFVVVHPPGSYQTWAAPFENIYQQFRYYFSIRRVALAEPEFPMVAVVLRTRHEFDRFLTHYHEYHPNLVGYYSIRSNRIITYDQSGQNTAGQTWMSNSKTIIHEAVHQAAFNSGLHNRFGTIPRWISEGLATMFEAKGVNNSRHYPNQNDRLNQIRLRSLQHFYKQNKVQGKLVRLIQSDHLFDSETDLAYALSWGLTFYLAEKRPTQYFKFLDLDRKRTNYSPFSPQDRLRLFATAFGTDLNLLESEMKQFVESFK